MKLCKNTNPLGSLCKDCKFIGKSQSGKLNQCHRHIGIDVVSGEVSTLDRCCSVERVLGWILARADGECGKEGRYFKVRG